MERQIAKILTTEQDIERSAMLVIRSMPIQYWVELKEKLKKVVTENPNKISRNDLVRLFSIIGINRRLTMVVIAYLKLGEYLKNDEPVKLN